MELATQTPGLVGARTDARGYGSGRHSGPDSLPLLAPAPEPRSAVEDETSSAPDLEQVWDRDGASVYKLACALLGDEAAAVRVATLAMVDLALSTDGDAHENTLRFLTGRVYRHSQEVAVEPSGGANLPPVMVWLGQLAQLQRACLALCVFGRHTHREAADLLDVPPSKVAKLLTAGLRELGQMATGGAATSV
jgi:hypothetical protein